jgi:hypothetical protein
MNHAPISVMKFFIIYLVFRINLNRNMPLIPTVTSLRYIANYTPHKFHQVSSLRRNRFTQTSRIIVTSLYIL